MPKSRVRRGRRQSPRASIPTALTPRDQWPEAVELDPIITQPEPPAEPEPGTDVVPADPAAIDDALALEVAKIPACAHCGGRHVRACPRIKRMQWHPNGTIASVEFWADGRWSEDHVIFLDEVTAPPTD